MFDYRRIALWIAVLLVPGGILLLPLLFADVRRRKTAAKVSEAVPDEGPKAPNDGPGSPHDGPTPRMAA